jgi:hypothetical protein
MKKWMRPFLLAIAGLIFVSLVIQLIPYGHDHTNPTILQEPNWNNPETRAITKRACFDFDCHSNETVWPWYSNIAPVSWLVYRDARR